MKRGFFTALVGGALLLPPVAMAQTAPPVPGEPPLQRRATDHKERSSGNQIFTLAVENDMFGGGSDRHYSSGVRLTWLDLDADIPDAMDWIGGYIPAFRTNKTSNFIYSLGQNLYTPENITERGPQENDRPWAAFLYGSAAMATMNGNHVDEVEATLGIVGPQALGEEAQKFIHELRDRPKPEGWHNQLDTEPGLMLSAQRRWPGMARVDFLGLHFSADPYAGATVGNIYTYANAGLTFRIGDENSRWDDMPLRVRPSVPGTGYFDAPERGWDWYLYGGIEARAVARNIFLDGNSFDDDGPDVDKKFLVADATLGLAGTLGPARISYTIVHRTEEFHGQSEPDVFGAISVGYRY